ncbi:uncharacterized protein LOC107863352 isoform X1 [Capsicum annuum]|uniref:uncharacterized protein LOC107863352 isoform X1 n=1 Tax=Capsicum annuum TaxID=4072 RepID=UPI001FB0559E|nr:uncharacterized protein LOC107863352 isoform X1 [Capsicum annuum]XP_047264529.1 uncharacterized protein LOC107863352 isoform X1 [Capsicum annuum]XP_047264530.1 uncharacterized protein LOC107863352 isoform X1 [Capsicum annuum]XP_047264531.1 uncharacterized protein LOC107863352 isoform X1 [Capsicum annuum]XP_047264532.1 uncharacterized protein LOC107863352 isoform X1 [Capsicum annuum]XP_047264533.1 uncharacterized protein LOC107863352 isoform X1 [Capsicum annuum]XP_047264534.1 uncharacterize
MLLLIEAHSQYSTILGKFETAYAADSAYDRAATKFRRLYANINFNFGYYHDDLKQDLNLRNVASTTHSLMIQQLGILLTLPHGIKMVFLEVTYMLSERLIGWIQHQVGVAFINVRSTCFIDLKGPLFS